MKVICENCGKETAVVLGKIDVDRVYKQSEYEKRADYPEKLMEGFGKISPDLPSPQYVDKHF